MTASEIAKRIGHLSYDEQRDMLNWLRLVKGVPGPVVAEAAEQLGIHPKLAFRGIWDDEVEFSYVSVQPPRIDPISV